ncbi:helix-turn-helix domain-containing protein [Clostridium sp. PL3]|uniref:Helix-turn-helix domain-containing protein n=1 Tax=Clostridium thailandense TaxID=2794346 RepID=A0A949WRR7_9CLOT|nr:helix-turn-helix domain-containing protein [Clostridium thailandense]MBV7274340.1 helix-turn-helix domain-containing protein [Clostridium thailandense]
MNISLEMIIEKLRYHKLETYLTNQENENVESIKLITEDQTYFEPSILYITSASRFPLIENYDCPINLLCIKDVPISSKYKEISSLNLIVLKDNIDLFIIFNEVQDILMRFNKWSSKLMNSLISNKGLQQILNIGYELIENPIILFDTSFKILSHIRVNELDESLWKEALIKGYFPKEYISKIISFKCVEKVYKSRFPVLENLPSEKYEKMVSNIIIHNKIVAHLKVFQHNRPFSKSDFELVSFLCSVISSEMQKIKFFQSTKGVMYEYFIADLLDGKIKEEDLIEERIKYLDLNFKENLYVLSVAIDNFDNENSPISQIRDYLENILSGGRSIIYKDYIVIIITSNKTTVSEKDLRVLETFFHNNKLCAGLSRHFTKLTDIHKYFSQSLKSMELGSRIHKKISFFQYNDYAIYDMMNVYSSEALKDFYNPSFLTLIEYDKKHNTNYVQTLYIYISNDKNKVASADLLHIHRNTLNYRIAKINEIMQVDLNNRDLLFHINLSFKILEFVNKR